MAPAFSGMIRYLFRHEALANLYTTKTIISVPINILSLSEYCDPFSCTVLPQSPHRDDVINVYDVLTFHI